MEQDQYGFNYYEWASFHWIKPKDIWSFVDIGPEYDDFYKVKVGMKYILYSRLRNVYEVYEITEYTRESDLMPYIKQQRIYLLP